MRFFVVLLAIGISHARVIDNLCNGVIVHNINHEKEVIKDKINSPYQLVIDYDTNTLFFSYTANEDEVFKSAYVNLKTNEYSTIPGIRGGFASAVDQKSQIVYLGGRDGVYVYDFKQKAATHVSPRGHNIWQMFFKDNLYYTTYPEEAVYVFKNNEYSLLQELKDTRALLVAFDNDRNIYFSNSSGLFVHKKEKNTVFNIGLYNLNAFAADINGNLYFSTPDSIYSIKDIEIEQIAKINGIYGMAIEADNSIIYAAAESIVRLKPTKTPCFLDEKKQVSEYNSL